ncbi:hypothetical protein D9619_009366 [Psilocybe cf. subviscida]|uniref:Rho-GAP domain-containing protein n=1 Tax=Psilocybe cf. subviscida TaxID=2480587 RepID=A0A8H5FAA1_9AGAR|nr:hypothetical protein D9619_009366 [Psilocybe cf. subviscida]
MHAFLSKIFGRKKDEKKDEETSPTALSPTQLLDGKFEAVSPTVSPSASKFLELDQTNGERDQSTSSARTTTRPTSLDGKSSKLDTLPHLSLNFGETRTEGFLLDDEIRGLSDNLIGERRLNPLEALILIRSCSQAITAHGLETLGLMHPHWYSSSPDTQRKLISQFLHSQSIKNANDTITTTFDSAIESTRSMHDIAAVLRWGLRHLQLDGDSFGTDAGWYKTFLDAEAAAQYPPKAFSEKLAPMIPLAHLELLTTTLELFSSLAAHSEANSTSGSKLAKLFGIWLLTARQIEDKDDWFSFYARWERTGRQLEHLFLARIRDTNEDERMPIRLLELVRKYPYTQGLSSPTTDIQLLPRPRLSTPIYDALFVRIEIEFPPSARKPKSKMHPLNLLADAFATKVTTGEYADLWTKITAASKNGESPLPLSNIFADETIRFLSIVPDSNKAKEAKSPTFSLLQSPSSPSAGSLASVEAEVQAATQAPSSHKKFATEPITPLTASASAIGNDWDQFSSSGFLDSSPAIAPLVATLFDQDIEKTVPPEPSAALSRRSSRRVKAISRKSVDLSRTPPKDVAYFPAPTEAGPNEINPVVRAARLEMIQFDEAFIDFWTDSLLDPITAKWPTFIICKFKSTLVPSLTYGAPSEDNQQQKQLKWLVLEQVYTSAKPPPPIMLPTPDATPMTSPVEQARAVSPTPSTKKRFNFWSMSRSTSSTSTGSANGKKKAPTGKVNEMGELVEESAEQVKNKYVAQTANEDPSKKVVTRVPVPAEEIKDSSAVPVAAAAAAVAATTVAATAVAAAAVTADSETTTPPEEDKTPTQEIVAPIQEEVSNPQAVAEAVVPALESVHADAQVGTPVADTVPPPPAATSELTTTPTEPPSIGPTADAAAPAFDEPEVPATPTGLVREAIAPQAVPLVVEPEIPPQAEEVTAAAHTEATSTPAVETVSIVETPPVVEEVPAALSDDVETVSAPTVEIDAVIPVVEALQVEAVPPVGETSVSRMIEEPEVALAPVVEPADAPIVVAVSVVEAAPVIEKALPAPALEAESTVAPIVEAETATPFATAPETGTLPMAAAEAVSAIDAEDAGPSNDSPSHPTSLAVAAEGAAPIEPETSTAPFAPEEAELTVPPVDEVGPSLVPHAATVETESPALSAADIASPAAELETEHSIERVDTQAESEIGLSAVEAAALTSIASATTLSTVETEGTPSTDDVSTRPAHAEIGIVGSTEPPATLSINDGDATLVEPETETAPVVEAEASSAHAAVEAEPAMETAAVVSESTSPAVDNETPTTVTDHVAPAVVERALQESPSIETEAVTAPAVEAVIPHPISEAETTIPDVQAEASVAALDTESTQFADEAHVVPMISYADTVPSDIVDEGFPVPEAEAGVPPPDIAADIVPPVTEEESALQVADIAAEPEREEHIVEAVVPSVAMEDEEVPTAHQEVEAVASTDVAELAVTDDQVVQPVGESMSNDAHIEAEVVPHVATEEDSVPPVKEDVQLAPSVIVVPDIEPTSAEDVPPSTSTDHAEITSVAINQVEAIPQPQIEDDRPPVSDKLAISEQAGASEPLISAESVEEPTLDAPVEEGKDAETPQPHVAVAQPEDVKDKEGEELASEEPLVESVPERVPIDVAAEGLADVSESDPVLPPGLYPTAAQVDSLSDVLPVSEDTASVEAVEATAAATEEDAVVPPKEQELVQGGATNDQHTPEVHSATPTNDLSAGELATAPGESISAISPSSPPPNEASAPTVIEQEAPVFNITTAALHDPVSAQSVEESEMAKSLFTVATPTEEDDSSTVIIADAPLSSPGAEIADVQIGTAVNVEDLSESVPEVREVNARDSAQVIDPPAPETDFIDPEHELSEAENVSDTPEKDEITLADSAQAEPGTSENAEAGRFSGDSLFSIDERHIILLFADPVVAVTTPSETITEENGQSIDAAAAPATPSPEEPADEKPAVIPDATSALQANGASAGAEPAVEVTAEASTSITEQAEVADEVEHPQAVAHVSVVKEVSEPSFGLIESQASAVPEEEVPEVVESEVADTATQQATVSEDAPAGEEPIPIAPEHDVIHDDAVADAALNITSDERTASTPFAEERVVDAQVEEQVAAPVAEPELPVETSESPILEEEPIAAPEPIVVPEDSPVGTLSPQIIAETVEPLHTAVAFEEPVAAADVEAEWKEVASSDAPVEETSRTVEESGHASDVATHVRLPAAAAEESLVEDSVVGVPADEQPSTEADVEHAPEPSEPVAHVDEVAETPEAAEAVEETSRDNVEQTPSIEEAVSAEERTEAPVDVELEAAPPATIVDETISHDQEIHAAVEEPTHPEAVSLTADESAVPLDHAEIAEDAHATIEDMNAPAEPSAESVVEPAISEEPAIEQDTAFEALETKPVDDITMSPAAELESESPAEPVESDVPVDGSAALVESAHVEEVPDVPTVEKDLSSAAETAASPTDIEVVAEAEADLIDTSVVDADNAPSLASAEPEPALADEVAEASSQEPGEPDAATSTPEVLPAQDKSSVVEEAEAPTEDPPLSELPAEAAEEHVVVESAKVDEDNNVLIPVEHEDARASVSADLNEPSEPIHSEFVSTEPQVHAVEPVEEPVASVEPVTVPQDADPAQAEVVQPEQAIEQEEHHVSEEAATQEVEEVEAPIQEVNAPVEEAQAAPEPLLDVVEPETNPVTVPELDAEHNPSVETVVEESAVEHEGSSVPEEAAEQANDEVEASIQEVNAPVEDVHVTPRATSDVVEPAADAAPLPEPDAQHHLSVEAVAEEPAVEEDASVTEAAPAETVSHEVAQETPAPEALAAHEDSVNVEEAPTAIGVASPSADNEPVEAPPKETGGEALSLEAVPAPAEEVSHEVPQETPVPEVVSIHEESVDVEDAPTAVEVVSPAAEPSITEDGPVEPLSEGNVEKASNAEVPNAAHEESETAGEISAPSDESSLPVEPVPVHAEEAVNTSESEVQEEAGANEVLPEEVEELHAVDEPSAAEEVVPHVEEGETKAIDVSEDSVAEQALEESVVPEESSPSTEARKDEPEAVVDTEKEKAELDDPRAVDEDIAHAAHADNAADVVEDEEDRPSLTEQASDEADVIDQAHVPADAITDSKDIAEPEAPVQPALDDADLVHVVDAPVGENATQSSEDTQAIPTTGEISAHAPEDSSEQPITTEKEHTQTAEETLAIPPAHETQVEETAPLVDSVADVSLTDVEVTPQRDDAVADIPYAAPEAPASEEDPQEHIVDASPVEPEHETPTAPAHDEHAATKTSASETVEHPTEEDSAQDISTEDPIQRPVADLVLEEPEAPAAESIFEETAAEELPAEDVPEPLASAAVVEPVDEARALSLEQLKEEVSAVEQAPEPTVADNTAVFAEAHPPVDDVPMEEDAPVEPATTAAEALSVPEVKDITTEHAIEAETVDPAAPTATDVQPAEAENTEAHVPKEDQEMEDTSEHVTEVTEPAATAEVESEASNEADATTSESIPATVDEEAATESAPAPVVEDDAVSEPPAVEQEAPAEAVPAPVVEGEVAPTEAAQDPVVVEDLASVVDNETAPAEAAPAREADESTTTDHAVEAKDVDDGAIADAVPGDAEAHVPEIDTVVAEEEETAAEATTAPVDEDEVREPPAADEDVATEAHVSGAEEAPAPLEAAAVAEVVDPATEEVVAEAEPIDHSTIPITEPAEATATEAHLPGTDIPSAEAEEATPEPHADPVVENNILELPAAKEDAASEAHIHPTELDEDVAAAAIEPAAESRVADSTTEEAPEVSIVDAGVTADAEAAEAPAAEEGKHDEDLAEQHEPAVTAEAKPDLPEEAAPVPVEPVTEATEEETPAEGIPAPIAEEIELAPSDAVPGPNAIPAITVQAPEGETIDTTFADEADADTAEAEAADAPVLDQEEKVSVHEAQESVFGVEADPSNEAAATAIADAVSMDEETPEPTAATVLEDASSPGPVETATIEPEVANVEGPIDEKVPAEAAEETNAEERQADVDREEVKAVAETPNDAHGPTPADSQAEEEIEVSTSEVATESAELQTPAPDANVVDAPHATVEAAAEKEDATEPTTAPVVEGQIPSADVAVDAVTESKQLNEPSADGPGATDVDSIAEAATSPSEFVAVKEEITVASLVPSVAEDGEPARAESALGSAAEESAAPVEHIHIQEDNAEAAAAEIPVQLSEVVAHDDSPVESLNLPQDSDLIGNGNGHHVESDKFDAGLDISGSIPLPDRQDVVDQESSFQVTAAANGNGHIKTETDTALVEPTVVPISKLEKTSAEGESHVLISTFDEEKPTSAEGSAAEQSTILDESVPPTASVLNKVEELLTTAEPALDVDSIAKSLPLPSVTHDELAAQLTTTAVHDGDEEQ